LYGRRIPVVFAAGNLRQNCSDPYGTVHGGPQSAKNTITVGGISSKDSSMMDMSSWGPVEDGRLKPEIVAAGQTEAGSGVYSTYAGGGYGNYIGTSMSAPAVSGSMALILEQHRSMCPENGDSQGNPLPSTTKALLIHGAEDLDDPSTSYLNPGPDFSSGYGRINDRRAVELVANHVEGAIEQELTDEYQVEITSQASFKVTLVWDDVPAESNAGRALVNDLDLEVIAPDGSTVYGPWILDASQEERPAQRNVWSSGDPGVRDTVNVVEQVLVDEPDAGTWTIRVSGSSVPLGPQPYSIVSEQLQNDYCEGEAVPTAVSLLHTEAQDAAGPTAAMALFLAFNSLGLATLLVRFGRSD
jgi:subtilisin family serine protease